MTTTMFPIRIESCGAEHWFAWRSVDDPQGAIQRNDEGPLVSPSLFVLCARWSEAHPEIAIEDVPLTIDLDASIANLRDESPIDAEALLNALNMLDDIAHVCRTSGCAGTFGGIASCVDLYDLVFSRTNAGRLVGMPSRSMSEANRRALADWLEAGAEMVCGLANSKT